MLRFICSMCLPLVDIPAPRRGEILRQIREALAAKVSRARSRYFGGAFSLCLA